MKETYLEIPRIKQDQLKNDFGKYVQKHRKLKSYARQRSAHILSNTTKSVSCTKRGEPIPSYENTFRLAAVLDMSLDEFVFGHRRFDNTIGVDERKHMLETFSEKEQEVVLKGLKTICEAAVGGR